MLPRIAVTMGDPAGIGPEICLQLLANERIQEDCIPIVIGDAEVLEAAADATGLTPCNRVFENLATAREPGVLDLPTINADEFSPGTVSAATGEAAYKFIAAAIAAALGDDVQAVTTGPINKEALAEASIRFPGHTEILADKTGAKSVCMMQYSEEITCTFVTVHVGYADVPRHLNTDRILEVIELTANALQGIRKRDPKLLVCGLNPHAGEHGLFGNREEETIIAPAVARAAEKGIQVEGPVSPDSAFTPERRNHFDAVVCMYHDQGHIPVKALAFDNAVNTTLGLPIIRTSVNHGTALDIAWQGKANPNSLFEAVRLAAKLAS